MRNIKYMSEPITDITVPSTTGKFVKGNKASKGFSYQKSVADFRQAIYECTNKEDMIALAKRTVEIGLNDPDPNVALKAIDRIFHYFGIKPPEKLEVTTNDSLSHEEVLKKIETMMEF